MDALALEDDEGRDYLRKALGSWTWALIRRCPNGATQHELCHAILEPAFQEEILRELKHLSTWRKRKMNIDSVSSGERKRNSLNRPWVGVMDHNMGLNNCSRTVWEGRPKKVIALYTNRLFTLVVSEVRRGTWNLVGICADHCERLNTT